MVGGNISDILDELASQDEIFSFILNFVDALPKVYNTVDVAISKIGFPEPLDIVGHITSAPDYQPVKIRPKESPERFAKLNDKTVIRFTLEGENFTVECLVHNVEDLPDYPYGKDPEEFQQIIERLQKAQRMGRKVTVYGRWLTMQVGPQQKRIVCVENVDIEDEALTPKLTPDQFRRFIQLCQTNKVRPLDIFRREIFKIFDADEYLIKMVALFCLSPTSEEEMMHILLLSKPGEGKDYLIDNIIRPMVPCGKVGARGTVSIPGLLGAVDTQTGTLSVGKLTKYHHERMAVSEVQTWPPEMFSSLLELMASGRYSVDKAVGGERDAMEHILLAGNIPNTWTPGQDPLKKLDGVLGPKNREYSKQLLSRLSLIFAKQSLTNNPDIERTARIIYDNIDRKSITKGKTLFDDDREIREICLNGNLSNREKSRQVRERMVSLMKGKIPDDKIRDKLCFDLYQQFFGQYFKFVSTIQISVKEMFEPSFTRLLQLSRRPDFEHILCNNGELDKRWIHEYINLCKAFAKLNGHGSIMKSDMDEAEALYMEMLAELVENFSVLFTSKFDVMDIEILKYIAKNNGQVGLDDIKKNFKYTDSQKSILEEHMGNLSDVIEVSSDRYWVKFSELSEDLAKELEFESADIQSVDDSMSGLKFSDDDLEDGLGGVDFE